MGAPNIGNQKQMDAAIQQQAIEGQEMRRRAIEQQEQYVPTQERRPEMSGRPEMERRPGMGVMPGIGGNPELPSGINFGPGRANRTPERGSAEYEQLLQRVRGLNQGRR
jgi:hypothetical protein